MSILSTNKKLISIGAEYSAGQGIDITDHIISVVESAVGEHYSAGPNIDIYDVEGQPTISSKDWTNDIEQASANAYEQAIAQIPEPQDLSYLSGRIDTNTSGIDYISSVCLTAHQDWTDTIKGASSYSYEQSTSYFDNWISGQYTGDITNITNKITALSGDLGDYYKKTETSSKDEINDALQYVSANAGKVYEGVSPIVVNNTEDKISADTWTFSAGSNVSFVDDNVNKITRIDCTVTGEGGDPQVNSFVYENSAKINDVNSSYQSNSGTFLTAIPSQYATTGDVAELAQTISETYQVKGDYLTTADSANFYPTNNPSGFITGVDLSNYYTKDETSGADELEQAFNNIPHGDEEVNTLVHSNSGEWNSVSSKLNESTFQEASGLFLTAIPQEYLTESELPNYISAKLDISSFSSVSGDFLTNEDLNGYATESFVQDTSANITALIPSTTGFALKSDFTFRDLDYDRHYLTGVSGYTISAQYSERSNVATIAQRDTNGNYIAHTYYTSAAASALSSMLSGAIDFVSGQVDNKLETTSFDELSSNINSNSGTWNDVVNKLYISSYHELSAGANTDIQGYVISSKDWKDDITQASSYAFNEATALIPTLTFTYVEI